MNSAIIYNVAKRVLVGNIRTFHSMYTTLTVDTHRYNSHSKFLDLSKESNLSTIRRFKYSKKKVLQNRVEESNDEEEDEDEEEEDNDDEDEDEDEGSGKRHERKVRTLRLDAVTKVAMSISRAKAEQAFYGSKLRVNGKLMPKKSYQVDEGDEIDLVVGRSETNPDILIVNRVKVESIRVTNDAYKLMISKENNLLINDYDKK